MSAENTRSAAIGRMTGANQIKIAPPRRRLDLVSILGLVFSILLIAGAIAIGQSDASFLNWPSVLIVVAGTLTATAISYTGEELRHVPGILGNTFVRRVYAPSQMALQLMQIASLARAKGILALSGMDKELQKDPLLRQGIQMVTDGYTADDIEAVLGTEVDSQTARQHRAASMMRRASEIAPAMGLIGTLIGLVQMLSEIDAPSKIGSAMALALLTTFYGAIMGTVILAPLGAKLERNANDEAMVKELILTAMASIARQENPRRLEMQLNSALPPEHRIRFFR